jgi:flavin-dependent dehydrogenase
MLDALIIGGGPAGAVAAIELAGRGRSVVLVEQRRFPRDKVCGECLSSLGISVLQRLGVATSVGHLRPRELRRATLYAPNGRSCELDLPQPMWGISRQALDAALLTAARDAGAQIFQPARCEGIHGGTPPCAMVRDLSDNSTQRLQARCIVVADGKGMVAQRPKLTGDLGVKATFENVQVPADAIELFGLRGHYGGLAPIEDGWNAAFSVPAARVAQFGRDLDALMKTAIAQNVALARRLSGAARTGPWLVSPLPRFGVQATWPQGVVLIGNAAAALEPIGGEGMGLAMRSAEIAAAAVDAAWRSGAPVGSELPGRFHRLWDRRRFFCRALAMAMSQPTAARLTVMLGSAGAGLPRLALGAMGKLPRPVARFAAVTQ